jgi:acyl carrier protein
MSDDIEARAKRIFVEHLGVEECRLTDDARLSDLSPDSLDRIEVVIEVVMALEQEFGCELDDDTVDDIVTFGDAIQALRTALKRSAAV